MPLTMEPLLQKMIGIIVRELNPKQVILFGSQARGTANSASDVDLLIIQDRPFSPGETRRRQMAKVWRLLAHYPISQDLLVYTPEEIEEWRSSRNHVIGRALREGKLLYERS
jgi:uncharacterized protein